MGAAVMPPANIAEGRGSGVEVLQSRLPEGLRGERLTG